MQPWSYDLPLSSLHSTYLTQLWYSCSSPLGLGHFWKAVFRSMPQWHKGSPSRRSMVVLRARCALSAKEPERCSFKSPTQESRKSSEATIIPPLKSRQNLGNEAWLVRDVVACSLFVPEAVVTRDANRMLNLAIVKFIFHNIIVYNTVVNDVRSLKKTSLNILACILLFISFTQKRRTNFSTYYIYNLTIPYCNRKSWLNTVSQMLRVQLHQFFKSTLI